MHRGLPSLAAPPGQVVACPVAGFGIVQARPEEIEYLRRNPVAPPGEPLSANFLKHSGDQTVAGLAAVYQAIQNFDLTGSRFRRWGVIAAPCFLGRVTMAQALKRFAVEGAWGISPHFIPHQSVHAVSGTISQALGIQGPNFGVGDMPGGVAEAMLVAASLLSAADLPGLWVVLTEHDPELIPPHPDGTSANGTALPESLCSALALALVPQLTPSMGITMHVCARGNSREDGPAPDWYTWESLKNVADLIRVFSHNGACQGNWRLGSAGWIKVQSASAGLEMKP